CDLHSGPEWQAGMSSGHLSLVEWLTAGGLASLKFLSVPRRYTHFGLVNGNDRAHRNRAVLAGLGIISRAHYHPRCDCAGHKHLSHLHLRRFRRFRRIACLTRILPLASVLPGHAAFVWKLESFR